MNMNNKNVGLYESILRIQEKRLDTQFPDYTSKVFYKEGHRDARHAAAELVQEREQILLDCIQELYSYVDNLESYTLNFHTNEMLERATKLLEDK